MIAFSFQIDPHVVLGVPAGATLQEIRDAYRQQAKKLHPDTGGAEWAFRVLVQSYEVLSTARVDQASRVESKGRTAHPSNGREEENGHAAEAKATVDPAHIVGVERLSVRYEAEPLWLINDTKVEENSLSCSLNFRWPDPAAPSGVASSSEGERILGRLTEVFEGMCLKTQVVTSRIRVNENSFTGWLSYPSLERASAAYRLLHGMLTAQGFTIKQWSRDLVIPRTWR